MEPIKDILNKVISDISLRKPQAQEKIQHIWRGVCEGKAARHSTIKELRNGKLIVHVDSPAWLFQLNLKKRKILEELTREIPEITSIYFCIGKIK